jgi:RNA polymerase sigma-70 factor (ECF subfamily)
MQIADDSTAVVCQLIQGRNVEDNFRKLFLRYHAPVFAFFARNGFSGEDCKDLTQEVFLAVYTSVGSLRTETAFVAWLFSIARHVGMRHLERSKRPGRRSETSEESDRVLEMIPARESDSLHRLLDQERTNIVREALRELPPRVQDCLRARLLDGLKYADIGEKLGIHENTVAVHVHRGLKAIRTNLKRLFGGAPVVGGV